MTTPKQMEPNVNIALGNLLKAMMPTCKVLSENTQTFPDHLGRHADVLVTATGRSPVTVEAEFEPAPEAEKDARERLGLKVEGEPRTIEASVAVRYPAALVPAYDLSSALSEATLSYCVLYEDESRFPESGWLQGNVEDLADLVRLVSVPQKEVEQAADILETGIKDAATVFQEMAKERPELCEEIADFLKMPDVLQTYRMASAILANALIFHELIVGMHKGITNLLQLDEPKGPPLQVSTIEAWDKILEINYYPIFGIAKEILWKLPSKEAVDILGKLRATALSVSGTGVDMAHDLTGRIFQRLIADRKYLATFYTRPASAALLARLAVAKLEGVDWSDIEALGKLRVGDFACGTGALLSAVYEQIAARHERVGGDLGKLHPVMMEQVLYGCDVMPSAVHITGATLAGAQPNVDYRQSRLYTMPYGRQPDNSVKIGSLELLQRSEVQTLFNTSDPALRTGSLGEETASQVNVDIPDGSFDLVIMNPPFTRAGSDWEGSERAEDSIKQFRGLSTDQDTQKAMAAREKDLSKDTCAHGYAGMASTFAALADRKLRPGGVLALVLPLSAAAGISWEKFRQLLEESYSDLTIVSIAANGKEMSFSADTGMGECLVVARKLPEEANPPNSRVINISLKRSPQSLVHSAEINKKVFALDSVWGIEDGPYDGSGILLGNETVAKYLTSPSSPSEGSWPCTRMRDFSLAQTAYALEDSRLWLPACATALELKTVSLKHVGERGLHDMNIAGKSSSAPFARIESSPTSTYPALWNHDADREKRLVCLPDIALQVKPGLQDKASQVWSTASRAHINRDFTFGAQPLAAAFTDIPSIGGRVWPNVSFKDLRLDYAFTVWQNSSLGLLLWWWHANRQQSSKAGMTVTVIETLPVLDFRTLTDEQLAKAEEIFEEFRDKELMPAYMADADPNRALLDRLVIRDLLGFDESVYQGVRRLAAKWCAEPSVHGGKPRPKDANFVM